VVAFNEIDHVRGQRVDTFCEDHNAVSTCILTAIDLSWPWPLKLRSRSNETD
jgi:hypothetical protein